MRMRITVCINSVSKCDAVASVSAVLTSTQTLYAEDERRAASARNSFSMRTIDLVLRNIYYNLHWIKSGPVEHHRTIKQMKSTNFCIFAFDCFVVVVVGAAATTAAGWLFINDDVFNGTVHSWTHCYWNFNHLINGESKLGNISGEFRADADIIHSDLCLAEQSSWINGVILYLMRAFSLRSKYSAWHIWRRNYTKHFLCVGHEKKNSNNNKKSLKWNEIATKSPQNETKKQFEPLLSTTAFPIVLVYGNFIAIEHDRYIKQASHTLCQTPPRPRTTILNWIPKNGRRSRLFVLIFHSQKPFQCYRARAEGIFTTHNNWVRGCSSRVTCVCYRRTVRCCCCCC